MSKSLPTPLSLIERYFNIQLSASSLKSFRDVSEDTWIDFAKNYLACMQHEFAPAFLDRSRDSDSEVRLFFEPRLGFWGKYVPKKYTPTPLFGGSEYPDKNLTISKQSVGDLLNPLKKHLLISDSVYVLDSFYSCFDFVADSVDRKGWRSDPNVENQVRISIEAIKNWLPILVHLRGLIESRALVFTPYYVTPSFPYRGFAPQLKEKIDAVRYYGDPPVITDPFFPYDDVIAVWLNARLLNLDPVFWNNLSLDYAKGLRLDAENVDLTSDPVSLEFKAFTDASEISIDTLEKMRKNEEVFFHIRTIAANCKKEVEKTIQKDASPDEVTTFCRGFLEGGLAEYERKSVLRFVDEHPAATVVVTLAVGAALIPAGAAIGLIGGALLTPQIARIVQKRFDPVRRAYGHLHSLL